MAKNMWDDEHETFRGKSMKPGGGGRFAKMVAGMEKHGMGEERAEGIAAAAGRKKYGAKKMAKMAAAGRKHHRG